jgi:hypothetical protein
MDLGPSILVALDAILEDAPVPFELIVSLVVTLRSAGDVLAPMHRTHLFPDNGSPTSILGTNTRTPRKEDDLTWTRVAWYGAERYGTGHITDDRGRGLGTHHTWTQIADTDEQSSWGTFTAHWMGF